MMTTKLYWNDSHLINFSATVAQIPDADDGRFLVLNQSAFYPEGGGQPCDAGYINSTKVTEVTKKALELYPNDADVHYCMGRLHQQKGDVPLAMKEYKVALKLAGEHEEAQRALKALERK